jgi:predicted ester cyclase
MTDIAMVPFALSERPVVTRIRQRDTRELRVGGTQRTQPMAGFEPQYTDIVDYIVRITEEIWVDRAVGRIYDTYDAGCIIYSSYGVVRSVEDVVASTITTLCGFPDGEAHHLNVAWSGDEDDGFYTSHLGYSQSTNIGPSAYGPATGKRVGIRFCADCVSKDNRIHTEWLVRDNSSLVRQLGLDLHETAKAVAEVPVRDLPVVSVPTRLDGQAPRQFYDMPNDTPSAWAQHHFGQVWNARRFDHVPFHYARDAVAHWPGGRIATGPRNIGALIIGLLASLPDSTVRVEHVSWSQESDGVILAIRWLMEGTTRPGGMLGDVPAGKPVFVMGMTHMRFAAGHVIEEWTVFDEVGILAQAYRA